MPTVNFYLKKSEGSPPRSLIYLQMKYSGKRLVFAFGQTIAPANWSKAKQRVKNNRQTTRDGQHSLNDLLDNLERECQQAYNEELARGIPAVQTLKMRLDAFMNQNSGQDRPADPKFYELCDRFISGEIKNKGKDKSHNTLKNYVTTKGHLKKFDEETRFGISFDNITLDFFYKYVDFLKKTLGLGPNTIAKDITVLKTVLRRAVKLKYTTNIEWQDEEFVYAEENVDAVYLTEKEIIDLYRFDFSQDKRLEQVKDLFVFGCFVGLRFSDYSNIRPENIVNIDGDLFIKVTTQKTKELVIIPCNPIVLEIFEKYKDNPNRLPKAISNQKFNEYLKGNPNKAGKGRTGVCQLAGMTEKGRLSTDPGLELWQCISSHTARRSFATNYYLSGFPTIDLMKITGHKTEKAFLKYIRVTKLDTARRLGEHIKKAWASKMLKIAS